ncbi:MAG: iron-sulfur cluster assembly protein IscA [Gammaproteobacteria bacterium]|jgi:iron-sulfur cluster assembly protein|nr:iron-sulfur cluster assembly protein IscA [Gammaproteobacteria bacterium]NTV71909.1 iron-sulfur cluster assembly protein IscA [Azonexaceae bacterium]PKO38743.1 MAG: iron-sulfur cluster assembly protein IscA [Betaproteobacteria bacterium HGW-Betaproteobacteria-6]PKO48399.1 MAG: iron-sulfur cluster assembly protein IscA [Betaproteobacteria bacterium HGW-Betaproteobacteria-4]MBU1603209.1 iron-sulfur cluster assembly protein IscA [Gammaproteobacteria bacterium]
MGVTLSDKAATHVANFLAKRGKGIGLRLGVRTSGCSGMAYKLEFVDEVNPDDLVFEHNGVKVIVDAKSLPYLDGMELDFAREGLNEGFKFNNPNVKDQCGCGESFNV